MKYIKILPVWLCVLCLTGCCETENEIGATTETNSEGETEGTALQEGARLHLYLAGHRLMSLLIGKLLHFI